MWSELDDLFRAGDADRKSPLEFFITRKRHVDPPVAGSEIHSRLTLSVEASAQWLTAFHAVLQKLIERFARATIAVELVTCRDNIDGIDFDGHAECSRGSLIAMQKDLQCRSARAARIGNAVGLRKCSEDEPTCSEERCDECQSQDDDYEVVQAALIVHVSTSVNSECKLRASRLRVRKSFC